MNLAIWDIESSSASTDFGSIIEIGGILFDENLRKKIDLIFDVDFMKLRFFKQQH